MRVLLPLADAPRIGETLGGSRRFAVCPEASPSLTACMPPYAAYARGVRRPLQEAR